MGNAFSKGVDSAVSIITGIITGDMTGGLAGASAPWLAEQIKQHTGHLDTDGEWVTDNLAGNLISHAILGAVVAELQGNSALSGGAGAVAGEVAADIIRKQLYSKEVKDLTEEEKQTISALSQLASGLAVAAGGGNIGDASAAISSSKNAVENNEENRVFDFFFTESKMIAQYNCYTDDVCNNLDDNAREHAILEQSAETQKEIIEPYKEAGELLANIENILLDFTPIIGDAKAFAEAENVIDYTIASVGLIPGVGDAVVQLLKEAKAALKVGDTKKAIELAQEAQDKLNALDVGTFRELKAKAKVGDGLEHDHIPSFAALKKAEETRLGRPLTPTETKKLYAEATAVEVPRDVHQAGPTYGGKNTAEQIMKDAENLYEAVKRDTDALRKNMIEKGYDPKLIEDAINKIKTRNKEKGIY